MFRRRLIAVLGMVCMLAASSAEARELGLAIDARVGGDSNVLRSGFDKVEDAFFELSPRLSLSETQSETTYDFVYRPTFTVYAETDGINGIDHLLRGSGTWRATPRDTFSARVRYGNRRQVRFDDPDPTDPTFLVPSDRDRIRRTTANLTYGRQLTPAWSTNVSLDFDDFDPAADNPLSQPDNRAYTSRIGVNHAFNADTSAGISASGRFRDTRAQASPSAEALIWDVSINLSHRFSDTMRVSLQAGPSFISTKLIPDARFVPPLASSSPTHSQDTSVFAAASLEKTWRKARLNIGYVRSEFRGGLSTSSTLSDDVDVDFVYDFSRRLSVQMNASWNQREQIVDVEGFNNIDTVQWRAFTTLVYRLTRQLNLVGQYAFRTQELRGSDNSSGVGDTHSGFLSLRYIFDPIIF